MIELVLVRHGESIRNYASHLAREGKPELLTAQLASEDYEPGWPLTELGHEQAHATGEWMKREIGETFDAGYVSPYFRALQTARGLGLSLRFEQDWRLRERQWGDYSKADPPYSVPQYLDDLTHCGLPNWRTGFPGGESVDDLIPAARSFILDRLFGMRNGKVVVVSHGGTLKAMQTVLQGHQDQPKLAAIPNCSLLHFRIADIHVDGMGVGEVTSSCPWIPGCPSVEWQHFG